MIRILFLIITAAVVLPIAYIGFKAIPAIKKMTVAGGGVAAAGAAILIQETYPWYFVALALLGVSFLAAFIYLKIVEKEQHEKQRLAEERREQKLQKAKTYLATTDETPEAVEQAEKPKPFGMQSIEADREEITRG